MASASVKYPTNCALLVLSESDAARKNLGSCRLVRRRVPRPFRPLPASLAALALAAVACPAHAAADDINAPASEAAVGEPHPLLALGRRLVDSVVATERGVVDALVANASATLSAQPHPVAIGAPDRPRAAALAARAAAVADAAADPLQRAAGQRDPSFGARLRVLQGDADTHVPCVSWMADVQPVTAANSLYGGTLRPSMHLSAEWALTQDLSLGLMPGIALDVDRQGRRYAAGTMAVTLGKEWAPGVRTFVDFARDGLSLEQGGGVARTVDAGLSLAAGPGTQVDIALARGLSAAAPPFQAGVGVSSAF